MHFTGLRQQDDFIGDNHISPAMAEMLFLRRGACFGRKEKTLFVYLGALTYLSEVRCHPSISLSFVFSVPAISLALSLFLSLSLSPSPSPSFSFFPSVIRGRYIMAIVRHGNEGWLLENCKGHSSHTALGSEKTKAHSCNA